MSNLFTNVQVTPLKNPTGNMKAHGVFTVAGLVDIRFTVIEGAKGIFASLPARKATKPDAEGKFPWYPDVKITDEDAYKTFQNVVKAQYVKAVGNSTVVGEENQDKPFDDGLPFG